MKTSIKNFVWKVERKLLPCRLWPSNNRISSLMDFYEEKMGYRFDINNPQTFTEKIQWYKEFYKPDVLVNIVDKCLFKDYIEEKLGSGYTIPLYGVWNNYRSLKKSWDNLPTTFVLKSTVSSDGNCIKIVKNKDDIDLNELKKELKDWFNPRKTLINSFCRAYHKAKARVIAEKFEENLNGDLFDYKVYCFSGEPYCICASMDHFKDKNYPITYYNLKWEKMAVQSGKHKTSNIRKPNHLEDIIRLSKELCKDFPFVRVDFFDTKDKLYVAELTFYPGGGMFHYSPEEFNKTMGDLFIIPKDN